MRNHQPPQHLCRCDWCGREFRSRYEGDEVCSTCILRDLEERANRLLDPQTTWLPVSPGEETI